jgi:transposase InsO family protein
VEAKALFIAIERSVVDFLFEDFITHFGVPREILIDRGIQFKSKLVHEITQKYLIKQNKSSPYHPQANGQVESTNRVLEGILTKIVQLHKKDWPDRLSKALWDYRTTWRSTTSFSPYELVYGKQVLLPIQFQIKTFQMVLELGMDLTEAQKEIIVQLNELDEMHPEDF